MLNRNDRTCKELIEKIYTQKFNAPVYMKNRMAEIKVIPSFFYDETTYQICVELKEEENSMHYSDLSKFYNDLQNIQHVATKDFTLIIHGDADIYAKVLHRYIDILHFTNRPNTKYYTKKYFKEKILVELQALEDLLDYAIKKQLSLEIQTKAIPLIAHNIPLHYMLEQKEECHYLTLEQSIQQFHYWIQTNHYLYIYYADKFYKCDEQFFINQFPILQIFLKNYQNSIYLPKKHLTNFFSLVYPSLKNTIEIEENVYAKLKQYIPQTLLPRLYLDFDTRHYLIANVRFSYETIEFNPFAEQEIKANRNLLEESIYLNKLIQSGFLLDEKKQRLIMTNDDTIYHFMEEDLEEYIKISKVYTTQNFNQKKLKKQDSTALSIQLNHHLLEIDFQTLPIAPQEIKEVLQRYKIHKKYYRLKDGSFMTLENNKDIAFLSTLVDGLDISYKNIEDKILLPSNRALYLDKLLKQNEQINVVTDTNYQSMITEASNNDFLETVIPPLEKVLRDYQKVGYKWLSVLDKYGFGGILADDMGLRKNNSNIICLSYSFKAF